MNSDEHLPAALYCCAEVVRSRQRTGQPVPDWLKRHYKRLYAEFGVSLSGHAGHEIGCGARQSNDEDWISSREAAGILRLSGRQVQHIAHELGGKKIAGGCWVFSGAAVVEYERKTTNNA